MLSHHASEPRRGLVFFFLHILSLGARRLLSSRISVNLYVFYLWKGMRWGYISLLQAQQLTLFSGMGKMLSARHHTMLFTKTGAICAIKENVECWNKMEHSLAARPGKASWTILADWVVNNLEDSCGLKAEEICSHAWKNYWYIKKKDRKRRESHLFSKISWEVSE